MKRCSPVKEVVRICRTRGEEVPKLTNFSLCIEPHCKCQSRNPRPTFHAYPAHVELSETVDVCFEAAPHCAWGGRGRRRHPMVSWKLVLRLGEAVMHLQMSRKELRHSGQTSFFIPLMFDMRKSHEKLYLRDDN